MTTFLADVSALLRAHRRALLVISAGFLAAFALGVILTALFPPLRPGGLGALDGGASTAGVGSLIADAYGSGNIAWAAAVTFAVNLLLASLLQTTLPTLIVPFLGVLLTIARGLSWGILFSPVGQPDATFLIHWVTLVIEGAAYVIVAFAAWVQGRRFLQPRRYGYARRRDGYVAGLVATAKLYVLVAALLVIGAVYEAVTVILFIA